MRSFTLLVALCGLLIGCGGSDDPAPTGGDGGTPDTGTAPDWSSVETTDTATPDLPGTDLPGLDTPPADTPPGPDTPCVPSCPEGACGDDGCGGECPSCGLNQICTLGVCVCSWVTCGEFCCGEGVVCHDAQCCAPQCGNKECGDDLCGGTCGTCPEVAPVCDNGTCALECFPDCDGKECGPDGCGGSCGDCPGGTCIDAACCVPACDGLQCGPDGCGGECGTCPIEAVCVEPGLCCVPNCDGAVCGGDGCGGSCGICPESEVCDNGTCVLDAGYVGCSDMTREGFIKIMDYPLIAACGGAWDIPGIHNETPACGREAGNTGANAEGAGCNVTDLCAEGWHVCLGKNDVLYRSPLGCLEIMDNAPSPGFFLTRTSSTGAFNCAPDVIGSPTTVNDIFGCGDLGCKIDEASCYPLDTASHDKCKAIRNKPTSSCTCAFKGDLDPSSPYYDPGNFTDVYCSPSSGGCGWCKPLDYYNVLLGVYHPDAWNCGASGSEEANNVVKTHPDQQGGVICCKDQCVADVDCPSPQVCVMATCQDP